MGFLGFLGDVCLLCWNRKKKMMSKNEEVEFVERRTSGRCKSEELVDLEQKGPGYCHRADENGIGITKSLYTESFN